jgi:hypothetical protein
MRGITMRTTIYINTIYLDKLKEAMAAVNLSKDELIALLVTRIIKKNNFAPVPYKAVEYQKSEPDIVWKIEPVKLDPLFYEKDLVLRRHFKFSFSWFIAFAIVNYLDELVYELRNTKDYGNTLDNYTRDYVYISEMVGSIRVFITMMDTRMGKT